MRPFEFVTIFIFIIFGMAISEVIISVANMLRYHERVVFYLPLFLWMLSGWLLTLNYFFSLYKLQRIKVWDIYNFGILICSTVLFVTSTYLVVPGDFNEHTLDLEKYFRHNSILIYVCVVTLLISLSAEAYFIYRSKKMVVYVSHGLAIIVLIAGCLFNNQLTDYARSAQQWCCWRYLSSGNLLKGLPKKINLRLNGSVNIKLLEVVSHSSHEASTQRTIHHAMIIRM